MPLPRLSLVPAPTRTWSFIMLGEEAAAEAMERILAGPRPHDTLKVWLAVTLTTDWNTNQVVAKAPELAAKAKVHEVEARRALSRLTSIDVLIRTGRGQYEVNPNLAWKGDISARERAAKRWGTPVS